MAQTVVSNSNDPTPNWSLTNSHAVGSSSAYRASLLESQHRERLRREHVTTRFGVWQLPLALVRHDLLGIVGRVGVAELAGDLGHFDALLAAANPSMRSRVVEWTDCRR